ncbi:MAG: DNA topoisomerase IV subunit A [Sphingomonadales bacterium]|nr:DNA topoisomerase IV subunit A [Sphingomonadales bacterium]PIX67579.1 MAG: DNA topoisomerase IV subunit A [Sphingomonadales bacterium CG_4_10_14_3_um_filter_58_15]NCO49327.1 DNA topoisomerase IV subunit A [Sphingomonadales bacterium]NCO99499.1 DNA topoisomerase IV subunit A [Sphingomonadales bacterium]NCP27791.1 DNA topoisomerase IV subunit A [Sphingomonadales bacterium]
MSDVTDAPEAAPEDEFDAIVEAPFDAALSERYLIYAMSTITARSLPDLRDGLKPVHRRLLWAMRLLKLEPSQGYKKCARVVGDVIGKYHPHGDQSVYDAMVRLAQTFSLRYPLVDGQGNFGNIDGDNAAAYRYTEARLTRTAIELMHGLDEGTVDFKPTYNGEDEEPEVMPGLFPNLLANGASGIAVGMATSIPSHNVHEIIDAATLLIDSPKAEHAEIMDIIKGPDLATGGTLVDPKSVIDAAYESGRGAMRVRCKWEKEDAEGRGAWQIVVTEIPYQVQKGKLIEQIAQIIADKKLPILADIRDESDEQVRIVLEPKSRAVDPEDLMNALFRMSDLENRFSLNMNVLDKDRVPKVMGIKEVLQHWITHQIEVLVRRSQHRLDKIAARLELLEGYIIAYLNLDRVIEIIRNHDEPKPMLMDEFQLTDRQAEAILNMRLRSLRKLEEMELRNERDKLLEERDGLEKLIESPARQKTRLKKDLADLRKLYAEDTALGKRRTMLVEAAPAREISLEAFIEKEPVTVIMSQRGWIKAMKGHADLSQPDSFKFKEGDGPKYAFHAQTTDKLLMACDNGRFYTIGADKLPGARGFGEPVGSMVDLEAGAEPIALMVADMNGKLLIASSWGRGFVCNIADVVAETKKGRQVVNLKGDARLIVVRPIPQGADHVAAIGENRKLVVFSLSEMPEMAKGQGVMLQRYKDGGLSDAIVFRLEEGLSWAMGGDSGRTRTENDLTMWRVARGAAGRLPPTGFPKTGKFD